MTAIRGPGHYVFTGFFYMPTGTGLASINFETPNPVRPGLETFLHLDLTRENNVRIDDNPQRHLRQLYPRSAIHPRGCSRYDGLAGNGAYRAIGAAASGVFDYPTQSVFQQASQQFGDVRVWMGFPWSGFFDATQLVVTHRTN